jgi:sugar lactone lactonase YvrE
MSSALHTPLAVSTTRDRVGESPVWSVAEQALYWVDIEGQHIHRLDWASRVQSTWDLPERVGCIALSNRSTIIAAMETGIFEVELLAAPAARLSCLASVNHPQTGMRFNDGRCDAAGRFWAGTMLRDMSLATAAGGIYCLDTNGLQGPVLRGYITPNGMAFSPDGTTAYLSDSHPSVQKIWRHTFDANSGGWGAGSAWVDMTALPGRPDGAAVDTQGCYWICGNDAGLVHQFSPTGVLLQSLQVPVSKPAMCAFGGPELRHLFVTTIQPATPAPGFDATLDGAVLLLEPGVQGLPEPLFSRFPVR